MDDKQNLPRLDPAAYVGNVYVHWIFNVENRRTGWLIPTFYYKFRELLTHAAFRYGFTCPIYCLMPNHIHMLWIGVNEESDQLKACKYFREQLGIPLGKLGFTLQRQPYDHILREHERNNSAVETLVDYIARNPERKNLVPEDCFREYKFTDCLAPGHPELSFSQHDYWTRFWRSHSFACKHGLFRRVGERIHKM